MKKIKEYLTVEEFENYCNDIITEMESPTCYFGQVDEQIPFSNLKIKHTYGIENDEHREILYTVDYNEEKDEVIYNIFED